jgi:hypothetical protein
MAGDAVEMLAFVVIAFLNAEHFVMHSGFSSDL